MIFPSCCIGCGAPTLSDHDLCHICWKDTEFLSGRQCDVCSAPLLGEDGDKEILCDGCLHLPPVWRHGRAAVRYVGVGRRLVLGLKHGDRHDLIGPMVRWMSKAGADLLSPEVLIAPVPLHPWRFWRRGFNQANELARGLAQGMGGAVLPDLILRTRWTRPQKGLGREDRYQNQAAAFQISKRYQHALNGRRVLLIDDVMTSGATLSACAEVCHAAGAHSVDVLVFARVAGTK